MRFGFLGFPLGTGWRTVWRRVKLEAGRPGKRFCRNSLEEVVLLALPQWWCREQR